jgi:hypothetical protein
MAAVIIAHIQVSSVSVSVSVSLRAAKGPSSCITEIREAPFDVGV